MSQCTQNIPGWQRHWVFCLLVQGMVSSKPSTGRETGELSGGPTLWENPASPEPPATHSGHRGGTAGRRRDGSSARCRNFRDTGHKRCSGCGCIPRRRVCLEWKSGPAVSGEPGSPLASAAPLAARPCPLESHPQRLAGWLSWEMVSVFPPRQQRGGPESPATHLPSSASSGHCLSPGGQREQQT